MAKVEIPQTRIGSMGATMPLIGFGTAYSVLAPSEFLKPSVVHAIRLGYRHFDTAAFYNSEECLGEAVAEALSLGLIRSRSDLFITSKLWCSDAHADRVLPALQKTLKNLGMEYVDLYLIHFPVSLKPGSWGIPFPPEDVLLMDFKSVWEAIEKCHSLGLSKNIGVSNFSSKKLETVLSFAKIPPAVNQVELNPLWQQKKLREYCKKNNVHLSGFSPLGAPNTWWGNNRVLDCEVLKSIAKARGKTVAQVCLRWCHQQGASVIVKSFSEERMVENLEIFDWELSAAECREIEQIPQQKGYTGHHFISPEGPYKSFEQFWDE